MDWLTTEQVKEEATTPRKALEVSIKHWWQNATATLRESQEYPDKDGLCDGNLCGLCIFYLYPTGCRRRCPLGGCGDGSDYRKALDLYEKFEHRSCTAQFEAWQKAAKAMHKKLCSLRKKK